MKPVLWVEDSETDQILMEYATRGTALAGRYDMANSVASGVDAGLRAITSQSPYTLVIVDMRLPGGLGTEIVKMLRDAGGESTYVVLTGSNDPADVDRTLSVDAVHHRKPNTIEEWQHLVSELAQLAGLTPLPGSA